MLGKGLDFHLTLAINLDNSVKVMEIFLNLTIHRIYCKRMGTVQYRGSFQYRVLLQFQSSIVILNLEFVLTSTFLDCDNTITIPFILYSCHVSASPNVRNVCHEKKKIFCL